MQRKLDSSPLSPFIHGLTVLSLNVVDRQEDAIHYARRALVMDTFTRCRLDSRSTRLGWDLADVRGT